MIIMLLRSFRKKYCFIISEYFWLLKIFIVMCYNCNLGQASGDFYQITSTLCNVSYEKFMVDCYAFTMSILWGWSLF